jgi:hypothetical protein
LERGGGAIISECIHGPFRAKEKARYRARTAKRGALCRQLEGYDEIVVDHLMETIARDGYVRYANVG